MLFSAVTLLVTGPSGMQADLKQRASEIEKKTKEVDLLNRKYEKLQSSQQGGPEAGTSLPLPLPL